MKLNRTFVQISTTVFITSAAFIIPMAASRTGLFTPTPIQSERITWSQATAMQDEYLGFKPMKVKYSENGEEYIQDLKSFTFNASQLNEIINNNLSGSKPDEILFMFGQEGKFNDGPLTQRANMRIIAVGMLNKNLLNTASSGTDISVYDKADPCPPNCPR